MKIQLIENRKSLELKDGLKKQYYIIYFLWILNILNAVVNVYDVTKTGLGIAEISWIVLGVFSIIGLVYMIINLNTSQKIELENIRIFHEKKILGRARFHLELKDGKRRNLIGINTKTDLTEIKRLFNEIGITTI